ARAELRSPKRWPPDTLAQIRDVEGPAVAVREHPWAPYRTRGPLPAKRPLDDREHLDGPLRLHCLRRTRPEATDRTSDEEHDVSQGKHGRDRGELEFALNAAAHDGRRACVGAGQEFRG